MGQLLKNLLKSPMFVIGISIFILTLLIAVFGPLFYNVDTHARDIMAGPYAGSSAAHLLGTDHLGRSGTQCPDGTRAHGHCSPGGYNGHHRTICIAGRAAMADYVW